MQRDFVLFEPLQFSYLSLVMLFPMSLLQKDGFVIPEAVIGNQAFEKSKSYIGVGTVHWFAPPLPPNRTGGSPASGSPVGGFTLARTEERYHGLLQG